MATNLTFELDAGTILAALHRGACETYTQFTFFNTGIVNDKAVKGKKIDDILKGKMSFDMDAKQYELGVIMKPNEALKSFLSKDNVVKELSDAMSKNGDNKDDAEKDVAGGKDGAGNQQQAGNKPDAAGAQQNVGSDKAKTGASATAQAKPESALTPPEGAPAQPPKPAAVNESHTMPSFMEYLNDDYLVEDQIAQRVDVKYDGALSALAGLSSATDVQAFLEDLSKETNDANLKKAITDILQKEKDVVQQFMDNNVKNGVEALKAYMTVFAGAERATGINEKTVAVTYVPDKFADPYKIKDYKSLNYQIPALTDEQVRNMKTAQLGKNPKSSTYNVKNMCFKIAYTLELGK